MKQAIKTQQAPEAIGPYSQAVRHGDHLYISGQIPLDPETKKLVSEKPREQVEQVMRNLKAIGEQAGFSLEQLLQVTIYITSMELFPIVNEVMSEFCQMPYPARAVVGVNELPKNAYVEMTAVMAA